MGPSRFGYVVNPALVPRTLFRWELAHSCRRCARWQLMRAATRIGAGVGGTVMLFARASVASGRGLDSHSWCSSRSSAQNTLGRSSILAWRKAVGFSPGMLCGFSAIPYALTSCENVYLFLLGDPGIVLHFRSWESPQVDGGVIPLGMARWSVWKNPGRVCLGRGLRPCRRGCIPAVRTCRPCRSEFLRLIADC